MRFDRLDLNLLVALDALIEERSVSAAAKRLYLSQPAISGALNRLREFFRDEILTPSGRQMILTPKAEELRAPVREALMLIRSRITTPSSFDPATAERHFIIAASDYAYSVFLAPVMAAASGAPGVTFQHVTISLLAQERFERGEIDLIITVPSYLSEKHPRMKLFEDEHAVICWSESIHRHGIDEDAFFAADHAIVTFGTDRHPALTETHFAQIGRSRRIQVSVPFFSALPGAVIGTNRLATMWRRHAEIFAQHLPIAIHELPVDLPRVVEEAQWHSYRATDEGQKWLLELVSKQAACM